MAAEPLPLSTLNVTSPLVEAAFFQPAGAAWPDGKSVTDASSTDFDLVATAGFGASPCRWASRSCRSLIERLRAIRARLRFMRARYWRHQRFEYFLNFLGLLYFLVLRGPASAESVPNGTIVPMPINKANVKAIALKSIFPPPTELSP